MGGRGHTPSPALAGIGRSSCACLGVRASEKIHDTGCCHVTPLCEVGRLESTVSGSLPAPWEWEEGGSTQNPLGRQTQVKLWVGETNYQGVLEGPVLGGPGKQPAPSPLGSLGQRRGLELSWGAHGT